MPDCTVICRTCRTANGRNPKRWDWLCTECAENCAELHRLRNPDHDIELRITTEPTIDNLRPRFHAAAKQIGW